MESLETGIVLMVAGMGTVAVLLTTLVFVIQGVSALSRMLTPTLRAPPADSLRDVAALPTDSELLSVIAAAVAAYRRRNKDRT